MAVKITRIPVYLRADTEDELIMEMINLNMGTGKAYDYALPPRQNSEGKWFVWFYDDLTTTAIKQFNDNLNEATKIEPTDRSKG